MTEKEYTNNQVKWVRKYFAAELKAVREAVNKVESTNTQKFEAQNEWRGQMKDQTANFVTRRELWAAALAIVGIVIGVMQLLK